MIPKMDPNMNNDIMNGNNPDSKVIVEGQAFNFIDNWFLMSSPIPIALIVFSYLLFVKKIGPEYMKERKPFAMRNILLVYNFLQVLFSYYLFYKGASLIFSYGFVPKTCVINTHDIAIQVTSITYFYFIAKLTELLDTIFFVLRKKDNQVTFLHVYHHTIMVLYGWTWLKYNPSYIYIFLGTLNSFVHIVMYAYYGLSSFPRLAKYLWWKKYITKLQLIQFTSILIHFAVWYYTSNCTPSNMLVISAVFNVILFMYLFIRFYINTYNVKNKINGDTKSKFYEKEKKFEIKTDEARKQKRNLTAETAYINGYNEAAHRKKV